MKKQTFALIMGLSIGLIIGVLGTYIFMRSYEKKAEQQYELEKTSITEKLSLEITKLGLKTTTYDYVDIIETRIDEINQNKDSKKIDKGMYSLFEDKNFYLVNEETTEKVENGSIIDKLKLKDKELSQKSLIVVSDKGKIAEAIFYIEGFQIKYNLIGTTVSKVEGN
ncbi:MAG: hypothetical protein RSB77_05145 [Bacilli bacterium]